MKRCGVEYTSSARSNLLSAIGGILGGVSEEKKFDIARCSSELI